MNKTYKRALMLIVVAGISVLVFGANYLVEKANKKALNDMQKKRQIKQTNPVAETTKTAPPKAPEEAVYILAVTSVNTLEGNTLAVGVMVTNSSKITLQLSPSLQFKLVGLTTNSERQMSAPKGTEIFKEVDLAAEQTVSGTVYFERFENEKFELRFYPDQQDKKYTVVPLIVASPEQLRR